MLTEGWSRNYALLSTSWLTSVTLIAFLDEIEIIHPYSSSNRGSDLTHKHGFFTHTPKQTIYEEKERIESHGRKKRILVACQIMTFQHIETFYPLFSLPFYNHKLHSFCSTNIHALSDVNQAQADYFFPVFLADFLVVFLVDFFLSSFFCIAFWEATFFTIFCSSMRKARRMLYHYSTLYFHPFPTDHAGTCGRGYHHKHGWQSAGKHQFSSYLCRKCRESIE